MTLPQRHKNFYDLTSDSVIHFDKGGRLEVAFKSDGQEISTIEWQELKNRFPSFFVHK